MSTHRVYRNCLYAAHAAYGALPIYQGCTVHISQSDRLRRERQTAVAEISTNQIPRILLEMRRGDRPEMMNAVLGALVFRLNLIIGVKHPVQDVSSASAHPSAYPPKKSWIGIG